MSIGSDKPMEPFQIKEPILLDVTKPSDLPKTKALKVLKEKPIDGIIRNSESEKGALALSFIDALGHDCNLLIRMEGKKFVLFDLLSNQQINGDANKINLYIQQFLNKNKAARNEMDNPHQIDKSHINKELDIEHAKRGLRGLGDFVITLEENEPEFKNKKVSENLYCSVITKIDPDGNKTINTFKIIYNDANKYTIEDEVNFGREDNGKKVTGSLEIVLGHIQAKCKLFIYEMPPEEEAHIDEEPQVQSEVQGEEGIDIQLTNPPEDRESG